MKFEGESSNIFINNFKTTTSVRLTQSLPICDLRTDRIHFSSLFMYLSRLVGYLYVLLHIVPGLDDQPDSLFQEDEYSNMAASSNKVKVRLYNFYAFLITLPFFVQ